MNEKRYSLRTVGAMLNMTAMAVCNRALLMGIKTDMGLTAAEVKAIREYTPNRRYARKRSIEELREELEVLG